MSAGDTMPFCFSLATNRVNVAFLSWARVLYSSRGRTPARNLVSCSLPVVWPRLAFSGRRWMSEIVGCEYASACDPYTFGWDPVSWSALDGVESAMP